MTNDRRSAFRCARLAAAALALGLFSVAGIAGTNAQDATPDASPAISCDSPGLPAAATGMATPDAAQDMSDMAMGTPEASATEAATGTAADDATSDAIFGAVENYFACYNEGQATGDTGLYVALESNNFVASQGYSSRQDEAQGEVGSPFATATLLSSKNATTWSDGRVSADVQALVGDHWFNEWRWFMVEEDGIWKVDARVDLPPHPDVDFVSVNGIKITETKDESTGGVTYAFVSSSGSWDFVQTDAMIFNFTNSGEEPHEAILMQLPDGTDPAGLIDGSVDMSQVTFLGGVFNIEPAASADLTMVDLQPGTYTLICFFPSPDGAPHAVHGMVQQFNVVPAEG